MNNRIMSLRSQLLTLLLAMPLWLAGCGGESGGDATPSSSGPTVRGVSDNEIVLGMHTDLSGAIATLGVDGANGTRMRFDEANEAGGIHGRRIRLVVEDNAKLEMELEEVRSTHDGTALRGSAHAAALQA